MELIFTSDYATMKKGDVAKFSLDLAHQLISVEKVAKENKKESKKEK